MANTTGLLTELGIRGQNEEAAFKKGSQEGGPGFLNEPLVGAVRGLFSGSSRDTGGTGEGGRGVREFFRDIKEQGRNNKDDAIARGMGLPGGREQLRQQRKTNLEVSQLKFPNTSDSHADQMAALEQVAAVASRTGDNALLAKTQQKRMELRKNKAASDRLKATERRTETKFNRDLSTGIDVIPTGADVGDDFSPSSAVWIEEPPQDAGMEDGAFMLTHPDGSTTWQEQVQAYNPKSDPFAKVGSRTGEQLQPVAIAQSGGGKSFDARREGMKNLIATADAGQEVTDLFLSFQDPQAIMSWFGKGAVLGDKAVRFGESMYSAFEGKTGDGSYTYEGKKVTKDEQKQMAFTSMKEAGISVPEHLRGALAEVANGAAQYEALIMEMAYMDARQQEPSNRGLSDNDIKAALARIGAFSANPITFLERQSKLAKRQLRKLDNLGSDIAPYETKAGVLWTKGQILDFIYQPELVRRTRERLQEQIIDMEAAAANIRQTQGGVAEVTQTPETFNPEDF